MMKFLNNDNNNYNNVKNNNIIMNYNNINNNVNDKVIILNRKENMNNHSDQVLEDICGQELKDLKEKLDYNIKVENYLECKKIKMKLEKVRLYTILLLKFWHKNMVILLIM